MINNNRKYESGTNFNFENFYHFFKDFESIESMTEAYNSFKAMDQPDHATRFLPYQHFQFV